jgi:glutathione S-transferase
VSGGLRLHAYPGTAAMVPHLLLRELGLPFEWLQVDRANDAHKSPEYLRLNPNGLIPVLVDDRDGAGIVLYETAAICLHLADTCPQAALVPAPGTAARAHAYKWMVWLAATLQPALLARFYPERWVDEGNAAGVAQVRAHAEARVVELLAQLDAQLASHGADWCLGDAYSLVDPYAFTLCRWTRSFERPARALPQVGRWLERMLERPAVQAMMAAEGHAPPFV